MVGQLGLDSLSGIDWSNPKLSQIEQFALGTVPGCKTHLESHGGSMAVCVERGGTVAWLRPSLERDWDGKLGWYVFLELGNLHAMRLQTDDGLKDALDEVFGGGE